MTASLKTATRILTIIATVMMMNPAHAYVIKGPHILHLMTSKLGSPKSLSVSHTLILYDSELQEPEYEIDEMALYLFPDQFRSDILADNSTKIHVFSKNQALTILDGKISSFSETGIDAYKEILLFRDQPMLEAQLVQRGIDVTISSLGRFNGKVVYIIGATYPEEPKPQIWIEKETLRPIRYIIKNPSGAESDSWIEFRYLLWQQYFKIWYPEKTEFYLDGSLERVVGVSHVDINVSIDQDLFDLDKLKAVYPAADQEPNEGQVPDDLQEIQQSIEDFKKRFE